MKEAYKASLLPLRESDINVSVFINELIDATARLELYKEKIKSSKLANEWFLPTLQHKEALASSLLEGTQATLDGVFTSQVSFDEKDKDLTEVRNYFWATKLGYEFLEREPFSIELILKLHDRIMRGNTRISPDEIGQIRMRQNYIVKTKGSNEITFTPPKHEYVPELMDNLIEYIVSPGDDYRVLVRAAIMHAQFLTIHPFMDGNGRVGRILIPLYLYSCAQIELPCFFISETLERDKYKYYKSLNDIRYHGKWSEWVKFFLSTIVAQCDKFIEIVERINSLYDRDVAKARNLIQSAKIIDLINLLYTYPVINAHIVSKYAHIPTSTANRYLTTLAQNEVLYSDERSRNRTYYYYDLLSILR